MVIIPPERLTNTMETCTATVDTGICVDFISDAPALLYQGTSSDLGCYRLGPMGSVHDRTYVPA